MQSRNASCLIPRACLQPQGSECGDAAVIIAEDEAGAAERSGPAASFLADVEAKLAAAVGAQCSFAMRHGYCLTFTDRSVVFRRLSAGVQLAGCCCCCCCSAGTDDTVMSRAWRQFICFSCAGGNAGSSDDEWVHCDTDAVDAAEEGASSDDNAAEMDV